MGYFIQNLTKRIMLGLLLKDLDSHKAAAMCTIHDQETLNSRTTSAILTNDVTRTIVVFVCLSILL